MTRPPRILIAGWNGDGNLGDELIGSALTKLLRQRGAEVGMFSCDPEATWVMHGVKAFSNWSVVSARQWADGVVLGPGGVLQDQTSAISCAAHVARHLLVGTGRARVGAGLGVGPINHLPSRLSLRCARRGSPTWVVRDSRSAAELERLGFGHIPVSPDLAHLALPQPPSLTESHQVTRVLLAPRGTARGGSAMALLLTQAIEHSGIIDRLPLQLVAMTPEDEAVISEVTLRLTQRGSAGRVSWVRPTLAEAGAVVRPGDHVLTGRFHVALMAQHVGNPWTAIDSGHKMRAYSAAGGAPTVSEDAAGLAEGLKAVSHSYMPKPRVPPTEEFAPLQRALDDLIAQAARSRGR